MSAKPRRRLFVTAILSVFLITIGACTQKPGVPEGARGDGPSHRGALITDADIPGAILRADGGSDSVNVAGPRERGFSQGEVPFAPPIRSQALHAGHGFLAYVRHVPADANPWRLYRLDDLLATPVEVYAGTREIQSVAVSLDGDTMVFSMREVAGTGDFEVYRFTLSTSSLEQLTSNASDDTNVSISSDASVVVWEGESSSNRAFVVRSYTGLSYSELTISSSGVDLVQPSVSAGGGHVAFIYTFASNDLAAALYDLDAQNMMLVDDGSPAVRAHPSPSLNAQHVAWLEPGSPNEVKIATPSMMTVATAFGSSSDIEHPHLTASGTSIAYSQDVLGNLEVFVRTLPSGMPDQVTSGGGVADSFGAFSQFGASGSPVCGVFNGGPTTPVTSAIPDCPFEAREQDYALGHPDMENIPISFNTVLLAFTHAATVEDAEDLITEYGAEMVGGVPGIVGVSEGIVVLRLPITNHVAMASVIDDLNADTRVSFAAQDALMGLTAAPQPHSFPPNSVSDPKVWVWESITPGPTNGNHGLKLIRVPQLWNLNAAIEKLEQPPVNVTIFDSGFDHSHPDLSFVSNSLPSGGIEHGTHVAGIIGAGFNNNTSHGPGIDGINPFVAMTPITLQNLNTCDFISDPEDEDERYDAVKMSIGAAIINDLWPVVETSVPPKVVNVSLGYNWYLSVEVRCGDSPAIEYGATNVTTTPAAQNLVAGQGRAVAAVLSTASYHRELPLIVSAAANDSDDGSGSSAFGPVHAKWGSPVNYAGLELAEAAIIVVEAVDNTNTRWIHSNIGGDIAAPGVCVTSTSSSLIVPEGYEDCFQGQYSAKPTGKFATYFGTSFAAPHVTGIASFLLALDPSLTTAELRTLLLSTSVSVTPHPSTPAAAVSNRVDAYAAALAIDVLRGNRRVLGMLLDIDDGTIDGNQRVLITAEGVTDTSDLDGDGVVDAAPGTDEALIVGATDFGAITNAEVIGEDVDGDGGIGDGLIDMADFRRWRDWYLQANGLGGNLNGSASHYKKDVNSHPAANVVPTVDGNENVFPRGDFNGDGILSLTATSSVPGFPSPVTDLEVLQQSGLWGDPFYSVSDLEFLTDSGDLEIWVRDLYDIPGAHTVASTVLGDLSPYWRAHTEEMQRQVYTLQPGTHTAAIVVVDENNLVLLELVKVFEVNTGGDAIWAPLVSLEADVVDTYDGPQDDCRRLEGVFTSSIKGLFDGAPQTIAIDPNVNAVMSVNGHVFDLKEHTIISNSPLVVEAKTVPSCNFWEGPEQMLGFALQFENPTGTAGFFIHPRGEFENVDNRWPMNTWNRTDESTDASLCPIVPLDIYTTHYGLRPADPQNAMGVNPGDYYSLLARIDTLYKQSFVDSTTDPLQPTEIVAAHFQPMPIIDSKNLYNGVYQWMHSRAKYELPACSSQPFTGARGGVQDPGGQLNTTLLFEAVTQTPPAMTIRHADIELLKVP